MATAPPAGQNTPAIRGREEKRGAWFVGAWSPEAPPCWNTWSCGDSAKGSMRTNGFMVPTLALTPTKNKETRKYGMGKWSQGDESSPQDLGGA